MADKPRILVITGDHERPDPTKHNNRYGPEDLAVHRAMADAFAAMTPYETAVWESHERLFERIADWRPDLVVNFCDTGLMNVPTHELHLPAGLETMGINYTGAAPAAIAICYDKQIVRLLAESLGIAVPREAFLPADTATLPDFYPALIKPNRADGSVGITKDAVVRSEAEARRYLEWLWRTLPGRDALYQEYLPGSEYGLGLIGNPEAGFHPLPMLEVDFSGLPEGLNPILSFESKAVPDSPYWTEITFKPAALSDALAARMRSDAERLFARLGLRDYGRFDFRVAADGEAKLMEVNPNPAWGNDGKLAIMAGLAGWSYQDMLARLVEAALARGAQTS